MRHRLDCEALFGQQSPQRRRCELLQMTGQLQPHPEPAEQPPLPRGVVRHADRQHSAGPQDAGRLGDGLARVGGVLQHHPPADRVKRCRLEPLPAKRPVPHVQPSGAADVDAPLNQVDPDRLASGLLQPHQEVAAAAAQLQHPAGRGDHIRSLVGQPAIQRPQPRHPLHQPHCAASLRRRGPGRHHLVRVARVPVGIAPRQRGRVRLRIHEHMPAVVAPSRGERPGHPVQHVRRRRHRRRRRRPAQRTTRLNQRDRLARSARRVGRPQRIGGRGRIGHTAMVASAARRSGRPLLRRRQPAGPLPCRDADDQRAPRPGR